MTATWHNASKRSPCSICGKPDWCSISDDHKWVCCRRIDQGAAAKRTDSAGADYWLHLVGNGPRGEPDQSSVIAQGTNRAAPEQLDAAYRTLLDQLPLTDHHQEALRRRGLTEEQIKAGLFRSLPERGRSRIASRLVERFGPETCATIPGLYIKEEDGRRWWSLAGPAGIVVPIVDLDSHVVALMVRRDEDDDGPRYCYVSSARHGGPGSGAPVHVPVLRPASTDIGRVTEGALKATVAGSISGIFTISVSGVGHWRGAIPVLRAASISKVILAFDADCRTNSNVARNLGAALSGLRDAGFEVGIETWDPSIGKGIDDVLAAGAATSMTWGDDAVAAVKSFLTDIENRRLPIDKRVETLSRREDESWPALLARLTKEQVIKQIAVSDGLRRHCLDVAAKKLALSDSEAKDLREAVRVAKPPSDAADADDALDAEEGGKTEALIEIGRRGDLFHDEAGEAFAAIPIDDHQEVHPIHSERFKEWLVRELYREGRQSCGESTLAAALRVLSAMARLDGEQRAVHVRVAYDDKNVWYDVGDASWRAVRIGADGWQVVDRPSVLFRRFANTRPQVLPTRGGSLEDLRHLLHIENERDWVLIVSWLIGALLPGTPRPALALHGEHGSTKSTTTKMARLLIDPANALTVRLPKVVAELAQIAAHSWALAFDNLTSIPEDISDTLCGVITGDGLQKRKLYTDADDVVFDYRRVVLMNGIGNFVVRPDLLDRSLIVRLPRVPKGKRRAEAAVWKEFEAVRAGILGAAFDVLAGVLATLDQVPVPTRFRMADAARIGLAVERVLCWPSGTFENAMIENATEQVAEAVEASAFAQEIIRFVKFSGGTWNGTASDLLVSLNQRVSPDLRRSRGWPADATRLSGALGALAPVLRAVGIEVVRGDRMGGTGTRLLHLRTMLEEPPRGREPGEDDDQDRVAPEGAPS